MIITPLVTTYILPKYCRGGGETRYNPAIVTTPMSFNRKPSTELSEIEFTFAGEVKKISWYFNSEDSMQQSYFDLLSKFNKAVK